MTFFEGGREDKIWAVHGGAPCLESFGHVEGVVWAVGL